MPVPLKIQNFGKPFPTLVEEAAFSGWDVWQAYNANHFSNPLHDADEETFARMNYFGELFPDIVWASDRGVENGYTHLIYTSLVGREGETKENVKAPESGYITCTGDGIFNPRTVVPFATEKDREKALRKWEAHGMPADELTYFIKACDYTQPRYAGRMFSPRFGNGKFLVSLDWSLDGRREKYVGSRTISQTGSVCL